MSDPAALHILIYGHVQGVYFRDFTRLQALQLGLTGWVHNLPDRSVEVLAEGQAKQIEEFINKLREGPPGARVSEIKIDNVAYTGQFRDFRVIG